MAGGFRGEFGVFYAPKFDYGPPPFYTVVILFTHWTDKSLLFVR